MPVKYTVRDFKEGGIYHIYNRGLAKREIFLNNDDFETFIYYLTSYLLPQEKTLSKFPQTPPRVYSKSLHQDLELLSYCLMPNHFHLLLKSKTKSAIPKLMKQLSNAYTLYFNKKYEGSGPIFQGVYKAVHIEGSEQLVHILRYIHLNPVTAFLVDNPKNYHWSSHQEYLKNQPQICSLETINKFFISTNAYEKFILDQLDYSRKLKIIERLTLES